MQQIFKVRGQSPPHYLFRSPKNLAQRANLRNSIKILDYLLAPSTLGPAKKQIKRALRNIKQVCRRKT